MDYIKYKLKIIEIICKDSTVSDSIKVQEALAVLNGTYDNAHSEGSTPEEAWQDEKDAIVDL